ncbi:cardiolipin synthase [Lysobacter pythonis]|uniref:Cardiolipin synthase n=1 Tax=Solilutibacter pythonis TaxID=2483112 RepID=A0A3M2I135_9GAMM|nr:cardiolipin synthase [Lysobacter pythonis]RMH93863.1 cardiolipin synthase [Lysobacter pythonis]
MQGLFTAIGETWTAFWSIPNIGSWITLAWLTYLLWLGGWIVLQKREPAATLSWLLSLALLPYLGFVIYYLLGPQKIERYRLRRARRQVEFSTIADESSNPEYAELQRMVHATTGFPPSSATSLEMLVDGGHKYPRLLEDIAAAEREIHLEYYIYQPDRSGEALCEALAAAARRGIKVRVLLDAVGSSKTSRRFFQPLLEAGGELQWFHPMRYGRLLKFWKRPWLNLRTHRKIVVIDGRIGYTGGINITDAQDERITPVAYRDLHLRLEGNVVRELQQVFLEDWIYAGGERSIIAEVIRNLPPQVEGTIPVQIVSSGPDSRWEAIHRTHVGAIHAAKRRVWMTTPYFVPGEAAMMALTSAALGGIDVRLLVPKMSDNRLVTYAARSYYEDLVRAGVKVYEYGPRLLHSKALLVDDTLTLIGTANFDHRSFRLNFEVQALIDNADLATHLEQQIESEFAHAPRVREPDGRRASLFSARLPEAIARLMSPLL